jgi:hypothetical protein
MKSKEQIMFKMAMLEQHELEMGKLTTNDHQQMGWFEALRWVLTD